jgi:hypothetical protein
MGPRCDDAAKVWHAGRGDAGAMQAGVTQTGAKLATQTGARWRHRPGRVRDADRGMLAAQTGARWRRRLGCVGNADRGDVRDTGRGDISDTGQGDISNADRGDISDAGRGAGRHKRCRDLSDAGRDDISDAGWDDVSDAGRDDVRDTA